MRMSADARLPVGQAQAAERGAGDWSNYQPPSAVLAAIAAKQGPRPPGGQIRMLHDPIQSHTHLGNLLLPNFLTRATQTTRASTQTSAASAGAPSSSSCSAPPAAL